MVDLQKLLAKMTMREKIGQLMQFNAVLFAETEAAITGPKTELGLSDEQLAVVGSTLNFRSVQEMKRIQDAHMEKDPNNTYHNHLYL